MHGKSGCRVDPVLSERLVRTRRADLEELVVNVTARQSGSPAVVHGPTRGCVCCPHRACGPQGARPLVDLEDDAILPFLQAGNRMDCPAGCGAALWALLGACWAAERTDRPHFSALPVRLSEAWADDLVRWTPAATRPCAPAPAFPKCYPLSVGSQRIAN